jgi:hypothetical protein
MVLEVVQVTFAMLSDHFSQEAERKIRAVDRDVLHGLIFPDPWDLANNVPHDQYL